MTIWRKIKAAIIVIDAPASAIAAVTPSSAPSIVDETIAQMQLLRSTDVVLSIAEVVVRRAAGLPDSPY